MQDRPFKYKLGRFNLLMYAEGNTRKTRYSLFQSTTLYSECVQSERGTRRGQRAAKFTAARRVLERLQHPT